MTQEITGRIHQVRQLLLDAGDFVRASRSLEELQCRVREFFHELENGPGYDVAGLLHDCEWLHALPVFTDKRVFDVGDGFIVEMVIRRWTFDDKPLWDIDTRHVQFGVISGGYRAVSFSDAHVLWWGHPGSNVEQCRMFTWREWFEARRAEGAGRWIHVGSHA